MKDPELLNPEEKEQSRRHKTSENNYKATVIKTVVKWLRPCAPNAWGLGSIPGQGTRSHMPQLKITCCN